MGGCLFLCVARDVPYFPCLDGGYLFFFQSFEGQTDLDQTPLGMRQNNRSHAIIGIRNTVREKSISDEHMIRDTRRDRVCGTKPLLKLEKQRDALCGKDKGGEIITRLNGVTVPL